MSNINTGQVVSVHYVGTFDDGTEFDSSRNRGEPLTFQLGTGQVIPGFDNAVASMSVGDTQDIRLEPAEAYGEVNEAAFQDVPRTMFPEDFEFRIDEIVQGQQQNGQAFRARIVSVGDETVNLDIDPTMSQVRCNGPITSPTPTYAFVGSGIA